MIALATTFAIGCFGVGLLLNLCAAAARAAACPTGCWRVDTMVINVIALIVLYGIRSGNGINFEAAMLFAMTGFVSTVAFCKFMLRGDVIE